MCLIDLKIRINYFKLLKDPLLIFVLSIICIYNNNKNNKNKNNKVENNNNNNDNKINKF